MWSLLLIKRNIRNKQIVFVRKSELVRTKYRIHAKWSKFWWFIKIQKITVINLNIDWNESDAHSTILAFYRMAISHIVKFFAWKPLVCLCLSVRSSRNCGYYSYYQSLSIFTLFLLFNGAHNHNNNNPIGF